MVVAKWGATSDQGIVRSANEDSYVASPPIFVIADGMGGHAAGEIASRIAVEAFGGLIGRNSLSVTEALACVEHANAAILASVHQDDRLAGMSTTITGLILVTVGGLEHWMVFNVGDSRVYRFVNRRLGQLTVDHSEVEEMVAAGILTREQARSYRRRNVVTRALGVEPPPIIDSWVFPVASDDRFIVCSDGLTGELTDSQIEERALQVLDPQALAQDLVDLALLAGGRDNITVIVVDGTHLMDVSEVDEATFPNRNRSPSE